MSIPQQSRQDSELLELSVGDLSSSVGYSYAADRINGVHSLPVAGPRLGRTLSVGSANSSGSSTRGASVVSTMPASYHLAMSCDQVIHEKPLRDEARNANLHPQTVSTHATGCKYPDPSMLAFFPPPARSSSAFLPSYPPQADKAPIRQTELTDRELLSLEAFCISKELSELAAVVYSSLTPHVPAAALAAQPASFVNAELSTDPSLPVQRNKRPIEQLPNETSNKRPIVEQQPIEEYSLGHGEPTCSYEERENRPKRCDFSARKN